MFVSLLSDSCFALGLYTSDSSSNLIGINKLIHVLNITLIYLSTVFLLYNSDGGGLGNI